MKEELEKYTYQEFKTGMEGWLQSGRCCWMIAGNMSPEEAQNVVAMARDRLNIRCLGAEDMKGVQTVSLEQGTAYRI